MDDIVKAALQKWPNVPDCYGWLALDARGDWYMRDERIQAAGPFPELKGSRVTHDKLKAFIERNYEHDARGAWYFQNGPQRVYVALEAAPWVWLIDRQGTGGWRIQTHTGLDAGRVEAALLDELGRLFLLCPEHGLGIVRSPDMDAAADWLAEAPLTLQDVLFADLPGRFGYLLSPSQG